MPSGCPNTNADSMRSPMCCARWRCSRRRTSTDGSWSKALPELMRAGRLGKRCKALDETLRTELLDLFAISAGEYLDRWFESDPIKAVFGFDGIVGNYASPYTPGSAYVLLHHVFGEVNGVKGAWGHAIGGMGAITQAMAKSAVGVRRRNPHRCGRARGRRRERPRGRRDHRMRRSVHADARSSPTSIRNCCTSACSIPRLVPAPAARAHGELALRFRHVPHERRAVGAAAISPCLPEQGDHLTAGIIMAPSLDYMDRAYLDARAHGWSREPIVEMLIPSTLDDTSGADRASTSRACSASRCSRNCPMDARGTIIATKSRT